MELVTRDNEIQFEKWYINDYLKVGHTKNLNEHRDGMLGDFYCKRFEMQKGVYEAYYDSLGIEVLLFKNDVLDWWFFTINGSDVFSESHVSRNEAYKEAFKKADELRNQEQ